MKVPNHFSDRALSIFLSKYIGKKILLTDNGKSDKMFGNVNIEKSNEIYLVYIEGLSAAIAYKNSIIDSAGHEGAVSTYPHVYSWFKKKGFILGKGLNEYQTWYLSGKEIKEIILDEQLEFDF